MTLRPRGGNEDPLEAGEVEAHTYRVAFWKPQEPLADHGAKEDVNWWSEIHDVTAEDVHEVIDWASEKAGRDVVYTLYVLHDHPDMGDGRTWLQIAGADPTNPWSLPPPDGFRRTHPLRD